MKGGIGGRNLEFEIQIPFLKDRFCRIFGTVSHHTPTPSLGFTLVITRH